MDATDAVIVGGARTPFGRLLGGLSRLSATDLGARAIRAALERSAVPADAVQQVLMGQVLQAGAGQNPARQSAVAAGLDLSVPAMTVNKVCLSGLASIVEASRIIRCGDADVIVAGGQESMTNAPHVVHGARTGKPFGALQLLDVAEYDGLTDAFDHESMGSSTERRGRALGIAREEQDRVALQSQTRAARAAASGVFDEEIVPVAMPTRRGEDTVVSRDEGIRTDSDPAALARLRPAFAADGTITAGNASPLSDGAAAVVVASRAWAERNGLHPLAAVRGAGQVAGPDTSLHPQPANALRQALDRSGWAARDLDLTEINEAFAAISIQAMRDLDLDEATVNVHGGAIAIGHPIGASGARLALHAALELSRRGSGRAGVSLCGGGGQGEALLLEA